MPLTRGAAKKANEDQPGGVNVTATEQTHIEPEDGVTENPVSKPRRTRSRRGKSITEDERESEEQRGQNGELIAEENDERVEVEVSEEPSGGRTSRSASRMAKGWGRKDREKPQEAQLVSFPSIMDEALNPTGTTVPFPEPYIPRPMYSPVIPATPRRIIPTVASRTPKFDPEIHGRDLDKDVQEENGVDTFARLIRRSPKKQPKESKGLELPPPLDLGVAHVTDIQLPTQKEEEEERDVLGRLEDSTSVETEPVTQVQHPVETPPLETPRGRATRKTVSTTVPPPPPPLPASVKKTRAGPSLVPVVAPAPTTITTTKKDGKQAESSSPPASSPKGSVNKETPISPSRAATAKSTYITPSKRPVIKPTPTTPTAVQTKGKQVTPPRTTSKPTATSSPLTERRKSVSISPPHNAPKRTTPTVSPRSIAARSTPITPPKPTSKSAAASPVTRTSPKQANPNASPRVVTRRAAPGNFPQKEASKSPPATSSSSATEKTATGKSTSRSAMSKPPAVLPKGRIQVKKPETDPQAPTKVILPTRTKRVAAAITGPVPPTKRIRPTPPTAGEAAEGSQNTTKAIAPSAPRLRIASLNTRPPPPRTSKPPTIPTGFRLRGEEVARKQAEAKEARKKRMEEAEAAKALLKEKEAKTRKPITSKTSSVASKSSRESNASAAVNGQLEREIASVASKKVEESSSNKPKTSSPPRPIQTQPIKPPVITPRPALVIQKKAPTTKLTGTIAASKHTAPSVVSQNISGPASSTTHGTTQSTPEQQEQLRKERIAQVEKARKQAAERGKAAALVWAAQQKQKQAPTASTSATPTTKTNADTITTSSTNAKQTA